MSTLLQFHKKNNFKDLLTRLKHSALQLNSGQSNVQQRSITVKTLVEQREFTLGSFESVLTH